MNLEDIKKLSQQLNDVTCQLEFIKSFCNLLDAKSNNNQSTNDQAMSLYINLIGNGALDNIEKQLEDISKITNEADSFICKVAEELENKKLVFNHGGNN